MTTFILATSLTNISVTTSNDYITELSFTDQPATPGTSLSPCQKIIAAEINHYFQNPTHQFNLQLKSDGTAFQQKVWRALASIPLGKTMTYGELARQLKTSPRAIGQACRTNPIPLIVPCHRVVGANQLGGFAGARQGRLVNIKQRLLEHEGYKF